MIKLTKKLHVRVFSFQTYHDANYGVLHVQKKVEFVHKERNMRESIFSLNYALEGIFYPNIP